MPTPGADRQHCSTGWFQTILQYSSANPFRSKIFGISSMGFSRIKKGVLTDVVGKNCQKDVLCTISWNVLPWPGGSATKSLNGMLHAHTVSTASTAIRHSLHACAGRSKRHTHNTESRCASNAIKLAYIIFVQDYSFPGQTCLAAFSTAEKLVVVQLKDTWKAYFRLCSKLKYVLPANKCHWFPAAVAYTPCAWGDTI